MNSSRVFSCLLLPALVLLAACEGKVSVDMTVASPADATLRQVVVGLAGVEFSLDDGSTAAIVFADPEQVDLLEFDDGNLLTLFTDEGLEAGVYTGARLLFDTDTQSHYVIDGNGVDADLAIANGDYAPFDFTVEDDETSREEVTLTLDLRQSLSLETDDTYRLRPYLRSVSPDVASILEGDVDINCPSGASLATGGAVYLFEGRDVVPDDRDGFSVEPYATAPLNRAAVTGDFSYGILDLPPGNYTVTATCQGDREDPTTNDDMTFRGTRNVELGEDETVTVNVRD